MSKLLKETCRIDDSIQKWAIVKTLPSWVVKDLKKNPHKKVFSGRTYQYKVSNDKKTYYKRLMKSQIKKWRKGCRVIYTPKDSQNPF
tara:strand:- start:24 stop:284 length:261 start_codon:yes stop_codon:yes gene_type:complete